MRLHAAWLFALAGAVAGASTPAAAQQPLALTISIPTNGGRADSAPILTLHHVFSDARSAELLSNGFAARISTTVELWQSRLGPDDLLGSASTQRIVQLNVFTGTYLLLRLTGDSAVTEGRFSKLADVQEALSLAQRVVLAPPPGRRDLYYVANVTIEILNSDDLAELQRWYQGDVRPFLHGKENPGSVLTRGLRTLLSRWFGGDRKRAEAVSALFRS